MVFGRMTACVGLVCAIAQPVAADDLPSAPAAADLRTIDRPDFVLDTEAMMFIWLPLAGAVYLDSSMHARSTPLLFSSSEGGKTSNREYEVPALSLTAGGLAIMGGIALGDDPSRAFHVKGMAESMATSAFITAGTKIVFGRHRPDFDPMTGATDEEARKSFPSGHASRAFSVLSYTALYLRHHGFDRWRAPGTLPWWEVATYAGLGALGVGLASERVIRNRHNVSDVVAGGALGTVSSVAFFYWQERQYRNSKRKRKLESLPIAGPQLTDPTLQHIGFPAITGATLSVGGTY
jgi:membrane-associated phospholipid phosphatase